MASVGYGMASVFRYICNPTHFDKKVIDTLRQLIVCRVLTPYTTLGVITCTKYCTMYHKRKWELCTALFHELIPPCDTRRREKVGALYSTVS